MKKCIILFISILLLAQVKVTNGCGWSLLPEEYRVFLLNHSALGKSGLTPLFYSPEFFYDEFYNWYYQPEKTDKYYDLTEQTNALEWKQHTKYKGPVEDVVSVIYRVDANSLITHPDSVLKQHPFLKHLFSHYKKEYQYLVYARKCELIYEEKDPWGLQPNNFKYLEELVAEGNEQLDRKLNEFLKLRYAYQLLKISYYNPGFGKSVEELYGQYIKNSAQKTWLKASANFYVHETIATNPEERQYLLTLSFDESIDKKFRCVQLFDRKHYLQTLKHARNNHERANIHVMHELQNPARSLNMLKKIAELDPENDYLPFLIAREINKIEDWLLTPELTGYGPSISEYQYGDAAQQVFNIKALSNKKYVGDLYAFIIKSIKETSPGREAELQVLASNICILLHQKEKGLQHLLAAQNSNNPLPLNYQIRFNKIALQMDGKTFLTPELQQEILEFHNFNKQHPNLLLRQKATIAQLYLLIGCRLIEAGDVSNGVLFCSKTSRPFGEISYWKNKSYLELLLEKAKPQHFDAIVTLIDKPHKSPFEVFLLNRNDPQNYREYYEYEIYDTIAVNKNTILDYKSMYYVQHDQLDSALQCVSKIDASYWDQYPYTLFKCFPFISGNSTTYTSNNDFYPYNKRQYLQRMLDVKCLIENKVGDLSKHYFVLANGYFNMSNHGNYWIMNMPYKLSDEVENYYYDFSNTSKQFLENYYGCKKAEEYFLKAFETTKDTAFAALCISKANLCNQNRQQLTWRLTNTFNEKEYDWKNELKIIPSRYKQLFLSRYKNKDFYDDFVSNCYHYKHTNSYYY